VPNSPSQNRDYKSIARRITRTLFLAQSTVSGGLIAMATVNAIAGADLSQVAMWAGLPSAVLLLATALGAYLWGLLMNRSGRRPALIAGLSLGFLGALISTLAVEEGSFGVFLLGMALLGLAQSAMQLGRFAAADVHTAETRGRAIATVVLGGTIGAVLGPLLVGPASSFAAGLGLISLNGAYLLGLAFFLTGAAIVAVGLRPEPLEIARELDAEDSEDPIAGLQHQALTEIIRRPGVFVAMLSMVIGQLVMVMLMVITTLHMRQLGHSLGDISIVISGHTLGMFAFSVFSGRLADRFGREPIIQVGALVLLVASVASRLSGEVAPLAASLFLLGLGWNFCYVAGSALLTDHLSRSEQPRVQGVNDLLVSLSSAAGSLGSGFVFAGLGYAAMGLIGAAFSLLPLAGTLAWIQLRKSAPQGA
jgi:MFS family permease